MWYGEVGYLKQKQILEREKNMVLGSHRGNKLRRLQNAW